MRLLDLLHGTDWSALLSMKSTKPSPVYTQTQKGFRARPSRSSSLPHETRRQKRVSCCLLQWWGRPQETPNLRAFHRSRLGINLCNAFWIFGRCLSSVTCMKQTHAISYSGHRGWTKSRITEPKGLRPTNQCQPRRLQFLVTILTHPSHSVYFAQELLYCIFIG